MGSLLEKIFIDPNAILNDDSLNNGDRTIQFIFLILAYAWVLLQGSNLISDGSELLLLTPWAPFIGSIVLPILGAVPDAAIVLFSGIGPDAKSQVTVGVGALAGSTIMLVTIPWFLSILGGRVTLNEKGEGNYKKKPKLDPNHKWDLNRTGMNVHGNIAKGAWVMGVTLIPYIIVQAEGFTNLKKGPSHNKEKWFAFAGMILSICLFAFYLWFQVWISKDKGMSDKIQQVRKNAVDKGIASLSGAFAEELKKVLSDSSDKKVAMKHLESTLRQFYIRYDKDNSGYLEEAELKDLLRDLGEKELAEGESFEAFMQKIDSNRDNKICFHEFVDAIIEALGSSENEGHKTHAKVYQEGKDSGEINQQLLVNDHKESFHEERQNMEIEEPEKEGKEKNDDVEGGEGDEEDGEEEEEEEVPEDLQHLSPEEQQKRIKIRAFWMMGLGTAIVLIFSDPMVGALGGFGTSTGIGGFFTAFLLAPLASNASEIIAAYSYAQKKTTDTASISLSSLVGAACMNNTFCLFVFLILIYTNDELTWSFSSETLAILFIEILIIFMAQKRTQTLKDGIIILLFFPLSIAVVLIFEKGLGWQ